MGQIKYDASIVALSRGNKILGNIMVINFRLCPTASLLGSKIDGVASKVLQHLNALAFLSVKRTILIKWKVR